MAEAPKKMPLEELEHTQEYQRLTRKQKLFVSTYVAGGLADGHYDEVQATYTAYPCKSWDVARVMSYGLMSNVRIIMVLSRHFNEEPIQVFLDSLDRAILNKKVTVAQAQLLRLKSDVLGFANRPPIEDHLTSAISKAVAKAVVAANPPKPNKVGRPKKRKASKSKLSLVPEEPSEYAKEANRFIRQRS